MNTNTAKKIVSQFTEERKNRFWEKVDKSPNEKGCWIWTAARDKPNRGYGIYHLRGCGTTRVHRISWTLSFGTIPDGMDVLHKCDTPSCVNPDHLFIGSHRENMVDKMNKGRSNNGLKGSRPSKEMVIEIRRMRANGEKIQTLSELFGFSIVCISSITRFKRWKHVG